MDFSSTQHSFHLLKEFRLFIEKKTQLPPPHRNKGWKSERKKKEPKMAWQQELEIIRLFVDQSVWNKGEKLNEMENFTISNASLHSFNSFQCDLLDFHHSLIFAQTAVRRYFRLFRYWYWVLVQMQTRLKFDAEVVCQRWMNR